jgi:hypothetical protein
MLVFLSQETSTLFFITKLWARRPADYFCDSFFVDFFFNFCGNLLVVSCELWTVPVGGVKCDYIIFLAQMWMFATRCTPLWFLSPSFIIDRFDFQALNLIDNFDIFSCDFFWLKNFFFFIAGISTTHMFTWIEDQFINYLCFKIKVFDYWYRKCQCF